MDISPESIEAIARRVVELLRGEPVATEMLTAVEAAKLVGVLPATLRMWRHEQREEAPAFVRVGPRTIRYRRADVEKWLAKRTRSY